MAPELTITHLNHTQKSDIFSIGLIFIEMLLGTKNSKEELSLGQKIISEKISLCEWGSIIDNCLKKEPEKRPTVRDIIKGNTWLQLQ